MYIHMCILRIKAKLSSVVPQITVISGAAYTPDIFTMFPSHAHSLTHPKPVPSLSLLLSLSLSLSVSFYPDMFEDMVSPVIAAQNLLTQACTKRKGVLDPVLAFCVSILQQPPEQRDYCKKDGALHVLGSVYEALMKKVVHYTVYLPL